MSICFIILAAGQSKRLNSNIPKPYIDYKGKPIVQHSIDKAKKCKKISKILLIINKKHRKFLNKINKKNIKIIYGGKTRAESSYNGLKSISKSKIKKVLIHDAARPNFSLKLLNKIVETLKKNKSVIPVLKPKDTAKFKSRNLIVNLNRNYLYLTQTPQGFDFKELYNLQNNKNFKATDDANYFIKANKKIKFINGENENEKITYKSDIVKNHIIKYGIGFDVHRLVPKRKLYLGGLRIKSNLGTLGHSDGDPVLHAIIDSILGACKMGDIGEWFSDKNKKFKNIRSTILLKKIINEIKKKNYFINNIDINIITQTPKISKYKNKIVKTISNICELSPNKINIKGKTTEKLGLIGKEKAIACEVIASISRYDLQI